MKILHNKILYLVALGVVIMGVAYGAFATGVQKGLEIAEEDTVGIFAEAELKLSDGSNVSEIYEQMRWSSCPVKIKWGEEEEEMSLFKPRDNSIVTRKIFSVDPVEIALERPEIIVCPELIDAVRTIEIEISTNKTTDAPNKFLDYTTFHVRPETENR